MENEARTKTKYSKLKKKERVSNTKIKLGHFGNDIDKGISR